jgi:phenylalanyl-tRNA synthetase beta chain
MLISYNWLKKFVKIQKSPQAVADKITLSLAEIENIEKKGEDHILEIENKGLTHRPDCFSHLGLAREVAAYFDAKINDPLEKLAAQKHRPTKRLTVRIETQAKNLCLRYCGIVLTGIKIGPSPNWLRTGLERLGIRSINNIVDVTNYVMLELGQPLHAFDYDKVKNHHIIVRTPRDGEKIVTLDGAERDLYPDSLLIADAEKPIALASIMGGASTEIGSSTKSIILESANFDAKNSRITSKKLNLRTEASTRYEKNLDLTLTLPAINRAIEMMQKLAGAGVGSELIDIQNKKYKPKIVKVEPSWLNNFIGIDINPQAMISILNRLGFKVKKKSDLLIVGVPSWRQDISMEADVAEEIARIYGYDEIPVTLPQEEDKPPKSNADLFWRKKIKLFLKGVGFTEMLTPPFVGEELLETCGATNEEYLELVNPLTVDQGFMRRSLIPSLLSITKDNLR